MAIASANDRNVGSVLFYVMSILWMIVAPLICAYVLLLTMMIPFVIILIPVWLVTTIYAFFLAVSLLVGRRSVRLKKWTVVFDVVVGLPTLALLPFFLMMWAS